MARYFFHTEDGECLEDPEGAELDSEAEARSAAVQLLGAIVSRNPEKVLDTDHFSVIVTVEGGHELFRIDAALRYSPSLSWEGDGGRAPNPSH